jgi:hypothetical protein
MGRVANKRLEFRVTAAFLERIDGWRATQPEGPSRAAAIQHLINLGLEHAPHHPHPRARRPRGHPDDI